MFPVFLQKKALIVTLASLSTSLLLSATAFSQQTEEAAQTASTPGTAPEFPPETAGENQARSLDADEIDLALKELASPEALLREQALSKLVAANFHERRAVKNLTPLLEDSSVGIREKTMHLMAEIADPRTLPMLLPLVKDVAAPVRRELARAIGLQKSTLGLPELQTLSRDEDEDVAVEAVKSLEAVGGERATKSLSEVVVNSKNYRRRSEAAKALGNLKAPSVVTPMMNLLKTEEDIWLQIEIARSLGKIGDPTARPAIEKLVKRVNAEAFAVTARNENRGKIYENITRELNTILAGLGKVSPTDTQTGVRPVNSISEPIASASPQANTAPQTPAATELGSEKPSTPAASKKSPAKSSTKPAAPFTIQVKATQDRTVAMNLYEALKSQGEEAMFHEFSKDKIAWYRVRVGHFASMNEAKKHAEALKERQVIEDFFVTR